MDNNENVIRSACPLFACRVCRTKTGWPHQPWCEHGGETETDCAACRYFNTFRGACAHPAREGRGRGHGEYAHTL